MLQIELLLRTLTKEEVEVVKSLNVKGKQRDVLQALIRACDTGKPVRAQSVGISSEHFHQIVSVLLQRCYTALASDELLDLATFLVSKNLTKLLYQQLKLLEVRAQGLTVQEQEMFYHLAFEVSQWVTYDDLKLQLVEHFGKRCLQLKKDAVPGDKLFVEIRILRNTVTEVHAGGMPAADKKKRLKQLLDQYREKIAAADHDAASYQLHIALSEYYVLLEREPLAALAHLHIAEQYVGSLESPMQQEERSLLAAQRADVEFMLGNYQDAYDRYCRVWATPEMRRHFVQRSFYHTIRFAEVATIIGNHDCALNILDARISHGRENWFITSKLMRYGVIALLEQRVPDARKLVEEAFKHNSGKSYAYFTDVRIRFLEVACAYLSGDWQLATALITRALQFIQRKKVRIVNSDFGYYFKFVDAAIQFNETGKPIPKKIIERVKRHGHFRFFALLLDKIGVGLTALRTMLVFGALTV